MEVFHTQLCVWRTTFTLSAMPTRPSMMVPVAISSKARPSVRQSLSDLPRTVILVNWPPEMLMVTSFSMYKLAQVPPDTVSVQEVSVVIVPL